MESSESLPEVSASETVLEAEPSASLRLPTPLEAPFKASCKSEVEFFSVPTKPAEPSTRDLAEDTKAP